MRYATYHKTVATADAATQLDNSPTRVRCMMFQASPDNNGTYAYIGVSGMAATTRWTHKKLTAPQVINFGSGSILLSDIYVSADTDNDEMEVFVVTES